MSETGKNDIESRTSETIHYRVNGEDQVVRIGQILTVEDVLRRAGNRAGIDETQIKNYYLENITPEHERKYEDLTDQVRIEDGDQFLAIYKGATPVA